MLVNVQLPKSSNYSIDVLNQVNACHSCALMGMNLASNIDIFYFTYQIFQDAFHLESPWSNPRLRNRIKYIFVCVNTHTVILDLCTHTHTHTHTHRSYVVCRNWHGSCVCCSPRSYQVPTWNLHTTPAVPPHTKRTRTSPSSRGQWGVNLLVCAS